jgi:predicted RND superfamily exporter protein
MSLVGLTINGINTVLPTLVFAIGLTDSIHLMIDLQRRRAAGVARQAAVAEVLRTLAFPSLLTALTTATGLGSLSLAHEPAIQRFGQSCAAGIVVNFVAVTCVFPLLSCTRLGDWLVPRNRSSDMLISGADFSRLVRIVARHHTSIVVAHLALGALLLSYSLRLRSDINATEPIASDLDSVAALRDLDQGFGGGMSSHVVVTWPKSLRLDSSDVIAALADVHHAIEQQSEFRSPFSVRNMLHAVSNDKRSLEMRVRDLKVFPSEELRRLVRRDLQRMIVSFHVPDIGAARLAPAFERLKTALGEVEARRPGFDFHVTGTFYVVSQNLGNIMGDLQRSLAACSLLVFGVIGVALRSLRISINSLLPDILPLLVASALLVAFGEPLRIATMLTFCLCFAISVDDTIHFLVRFQRARQTKSTDEAVRESFEHAGAGIVIGTIIVVGAFSIMTLSEMPSIRWFAILSGLSMLAALETMLLLLPSLLITFDAAPARESVEADPQWSGVDALGRWTAARYKRGGGKRGAGSTE